MREYDKLPDETKPRRQKPVEMTDIRDLLMMMLKKNIAWFYRLKQDNLQKIATDTIDPFFIAALKSNAYSDECDGFTAVSLAATKGDKTFKAAAGYRDAMQSDDQVDVDTTFNAGSVSKFIVMNMIMRHASMGNLDLNTPIQAYVAAPDVPNKDKMTTAHLLLHESGLRDAEFKPFVRTDPLTSIIDFRAVVEPGTEFYYANINFILLAKIIESISRKTLAQNFDELVRQPLQLINSYLIDDDFVRPYGVGYRLNREGGALEMASQYYIWGAASFRISTQDVVKITKNFFENPGYMPTVYVDLCKDSCKNVTFTVKAEGRVLSWPATFGYGIERHRKWGVTLYGHGGWQHSNAAFFGYVKGEAYAVACAKTQGLKGRALALDKRSASCLCFGFLSSYSKKPVETDTRDDATLSVKAAAH